MLATLVGNGAAWSVATLPAIKAQLAPLPAACEGPLLAHFGSGATECESPLLGAKRTVPNVAHFARGQGNNLTAYGALEV
jgi:hypothetical protein